MPDEGESNNPRKPTFSDIIDEQILAALTREPAPIRTLIERLGITDMAETRALQLHLQTLVREQKIKVTGTWCRKLYARSEGA